MQRSPVGAVSLYAPARVDACPPHPPLALAQKALDHLDQLTRQLSDPALAPDLQPLRQKWEARQQHLTTQLSITTQQLEQKLREQQPFSETVKDLLQLFFRSRGRNFLLGKVVLQTPEIVRLILLGGGRRTFPTPDFLTQSPVVLSTDFRLAVLFGLDYQHQGRITREIPTIQAHPPADHLWD